MLRVAFSTRSIDRFSPSTRTPKRRYFATTPQAILYRSFPLGHVTQNRYDSRNRIIETIDPDGGHTKFGYDLDNNLVRVIDPVNNTTRFTYDPRNRLTRETDPLGKIIRYEYDATDNLVAKTDRNGQRTNYLYDDLDRLTRETWVGAGNVVNFAHDKSSNLLSVTDTFSSLVFTYDNRNRVNLVDNNGTPKAPRRIASSVLVSGAPAAASSGTGA